MENFKLEAKKKGNKLTLSALTIKTEWVNLNGFIYDKKTPEIETVANYQYLKKNGIDHVRVV